MTFVLKWFCIMLLAFDSLPFFDSLGKRVFGNYTAEPIPLTPVNTVGRSSELYKGHRLQRWPGLRPHCPKLGSHLAGLRAPQLALLVLALGSFLCSRVAALLWAPEALRLLQSGPTTGRLASMSYWPAQDPTNGSGALFGQSDQSSEFLFLAFPAIDQTLRANESDSFFGDIF